MTTIYKHTFANGKSYIGQTVHTMEQRLNRHINETKNGISDYKFNRALKKYNYEIQSEILEVVESSKADEREIYWIAYYDSFNNGYNSTIGGNGNQSPSKETRDKISSTFANWTEERKEKRRLEASKQVKKLWEDPEYRKMQSESHRGIKGLLHPNIKPVGIFNADGVQILTVLYTLRKSLDLIGFPGTSFQQSLYSNQKLFMSTRPSSITKIKKRNLEKYRGWYAKYI